MEENPKFKLSCPPWLVIEDDPDQTLDQFIKVLEQAIDYPNEKRTLQVSLTKCYRDTIVMSN